MKNPVVKIFYIFLFFSLLSCKPKKEPVSLSPGFVGLYQVEHYQVDNKVIIDKEKGIFGDGISDFNIIISEAMSDTTFYLKFDVVRSGVSSSVIWGESVIKKELDRYRIYNYFNTIDTDGGHIIGDTIVSKSVALDIESLGNSVTVIKAIKKK